MGDPEQGSRRAANIRERKNERSISQNVAETKASQANQYLQTGEGPGAARGPCIVKLSPMIPKKTARTYYNLGLALDRLGTIGSRRRGPHWNKVVAVDPAFRPPLHNQIGFFLSLQAGR